jgi:hypothetical protein
MKRKRWNGNEKPGRLTIPYKSTDPSGTVLQKKRPPYLRSLQLSNTAVLGFFDH